MANQFIEQLERFKRRRKGRRELEDEEKVEETDVDEQEDANKKLFKHRRTYGRENWRDSCWCKFLQRDLTDPTERDGKIFRLHFTVQFQLYQQLLDFAESCFPQSKVDAFGKELTPISRKPLGTLRILGKRCSWDFLYELSGVSAEVQKKWTLRFIEKFSTEMYPIYVHGPRNSEELDTVTSLYATCGFPGCDKNIVHQCGHQVFRNEFCFNSIRDDGKSYETFPIMGQHLTRLL